MENNDIEMLFDDNNDSTQKVEVVDDGKFSVVTEQVMNEEIQPVITTRNIPVQSQQMDYDEYRKSLSSFYSISNSDNSLVLTFIVDHIKCRSTLSLKNPNGQEDIKLSGEFAYNNEFIENMLVPAIKEYNEYNQIFSSNIEILDGDRANFVARTSNNDSIIVMGIDMALANWLKDIVTIKEEKLESVDVIGSMPNQKGISNYFVIILTMITIGMTLVGTIFFTIMANK